MEKAVAIRKIYTFRVNSASPWLNVGGAAAAAKGIYASKSARRLHCRGGTTHGFY